MTSTGPLVSVILPFYNAAYLKSAIESILNQTYPHFELLLINNGSTDGSTEVAKSYTTHPKIRLLNESQRGVVYAANKGIKEARGAFIARMDADDVSRPDRLENQLKMFDNDSSVEVVSGLIEYMGPDENEGFGQYVDWLNSIRTSEDIYLNQFVEFPIANPSLMFRREVFERCGGYIDENFPEDYEFFLRLQEAQVKMTKVTEVVLSWRDLETRLTRTDDRYSQEAFFRVKAKYLAKWLATHNPYHPNVFIWGAGRLSRRRSDYLLDEGIAVKKYIDLKKNAQTLHYTDLPTPSEAFIVSYVRNRGARAEIRTFLELKGYKEGVNYILAS